VTSFPEHEPPVPDLDATAARRWFNLPRAESPWLHEEIASRMAERLQWFREQPASWLHWEPHLGGIRAHKRLRVLLPEAESHIEAQDKQGAVALLAPAAGRSWNPLSWGRRSQLKMAEEDTRVDMLWANQVLHLEPQPQRLLRRWNKHINVQGFLMFSCLGPDTLHEIRTVYAAHGWPLPHHPFTDMHDWGDMLVHSGFAEPVMDMERLTLTYSGAAELLKDLRGLGRNLHAGRLPGLRSRQWRQRLTEALDAELPRDVDGRLQLTVEVVYGHAFKAAPRPAKGPAGATTVEIDDMRAMLRAGRR
jgi:malonyl-CoA O-methyltransferase